MFSGAGVSATSLKAADKMSQVTCHKLYHLAALVFALQVLRNAVHCAVAAVVDTIVLAHLTARAIQASLCHKAGPELCVATLQTPLNTQTQ